MHPLEIIIDIAIGLSVVLFLLWLGALFLSTKDDEAAGVLLGPETLSLDDARARAGGFQPPSPALLRLCGWCDGLLHDQPVTLWPRQKITLTHGICPRCQRRVEAEGERIPAAIRQPVLTH